MVKQVYEFTQPVKGTPNSKTSMRKIPLPELIIAELRSHVESATYRRDPMHSCSSASNLPRTRRKRTGSLRAVLMTAAEVHRIIPGSHVASKARATSRSSQLFLGDSNYHRDRLASRIGL
jgi:hypothetical protein